MENATMMKMSNPIKALMIVVFLFFCFFRKRLLDSSKFYTNSA